MIADVQRELAEARWDIYAAIRDRFPLIGLDRVELIAQFLTSVDGPLLPTVQRLIDAAEKRAAAAARDHGRMVGAYETFASLASNLRHGTTFTAEDMDRLAAEYRTAAAALDPAGAASGETT